jgi:hypothetical protein
VRLVRGFDGMCVRDTGDSKAPRTTIVAWACDPAAADGEYRLKAGGYKLCLTDPGYSTENGTQLTVSACVSARDQQWSLP